MPKDGPSAGVTVTTALVSMLSGKAVKRDVAMTGEITLRGKVLPIGGLKEKTLAAYRAGVKTVIIPKKNEKDLADIDGEVRQHLNFITASTVFDVLENALTDQSEIIAIVNPSAAVCKKECKGGKKNESKRK